MGRSKSTDNPAAKNFADRLKNFRKNIPLSQRDFAEKMGFTAGFISDLENAKSKPSFDFLLKIVDVFNVNLNWLIFGYGEIFYREGEVDIEGESLLSGLEDNVLDLIKYMKESAIAKHSILGFALRFLQENSKTINKEIALNKAEKDAQTQKKGGQS
ncbi:MAG: helix-turn-helix transcriptional regulator [Candidatus Aminicenantes bacterium]|nr:helix-turn-helix transcriptional regulator [Candidatus Aminicenantes bacterium]